MQHIATYNTYTWCIHISQTNFSNQCPASKQGKKFISTYICKHLVFKVQSPYSPDLTHLDFYLWGHLKTLVYSGPIENEETLHQHIFYDCQTICNCPRTSERVPMVMIRHVHACIYSGPGHFEHLS
jgi:hypothetical protein